MIVTAELTNEEIIDVVTSFDRQGLPLKQRFEGDDQALRTFMSNHGHGDFLPSTTILVMIVLLREATIRGLTIPKVG